MKNKKKKEYNQISKKELIENDKVLIMNRFGFLSLYKKPNSEYNKNCSSSQFNLTLSPQKTQNKNKNKNLISSHSTLLLPRKGCRNYVQYKPSLTNISTATTNLYSSFYNTKNKLKLNSKTKCFKKEENLINSCMWDKLIKNIDTNKTNKINHTIEKQQNDKTDNISRTKSIPDNNFEHKEVKHEIKLSSPLKIKQIDISNTSDKKSSDTYNQDDNKNKFNNNKILDEFSDSEKEKNNIIMRNKNYFNKSNNININLISNINNINNNYHKNEKFACKFLSRNNIYDISSRDIKEEKSLMKYFFKTNESEYMFLSEIEKRNKNIANLNFKKFMGLSDNSIYRILSFEPEIYLELINSNKYIKNRIHNCLNNLYKTTIDDFKIKYKDILEVIKYNFVQNKIKSYGCGNNYVLDLVLNCKIITQKIKQSIEISCNYFSNNQKYDNVWIFDIQKKSNIKKWISSEINTFRNFQKNQAISYTAQISSFSYQDEIVIQINIFNIKNVVNPKSLEWCEPIISSIEPDIYEKTNYINSINYDQLRACEIEMQVLFWSHNLNEDQKILVNEIKTIFENFFLVKDICINSCKYDFYKLVMKPIKTGLITKNKICSFDINIVGEKESTKNEVQCIYFLNTNSLFKKMDINLGNDLIFYVIDMKVK